MEALERRGLIVAVNGPRATVDLLAMSIRLRHERDPRALVAGIDAAPALVDLAQRHVPSGAFRVGDMQALPYADACFDAVTGFNAFQYAASPAHALREAARVTKPGGSLVVMIWGTAAECEAAAPMAAVARLMPPPPPGTPGPFALSEPGGIERLLSEVGLTAGPNRIIADPWSYADSNTLLHGLLSAGPLVRAIEVAGEDTVATAVLNACQPFRRSDGSYQFANNFHHVICAV